MGEKKVLTEGKVLTERIFHFIFDVPKIETFWAFLFRGYMERLCSIEMGLYKVSGFGVFEIPFFRVYKHPAFLKTSVGYWEVLGIKIPVPLFVLEVTGDRVKLLHLIGESYFFFMVVGR